MNSLSVWLTAWSEVLLEKLTANSSACQVIFCVLWNSESQCRIHKSLPPMPMPYQSSPCSHPIVWIYILILPSPSRFFKWSLSLGFPHQSPVSTLLFPMHATWPARIILSNWSPEWNFLRSVNHKTPGYVVFYTPVLPRPSWSANGFFSTLFSNTLRLFFFLSVRKCHDP